MPYLPPSSSSQTPSTTPELDSSSLRPSHRRTRSATPTFSTESGPGAFAPLAVPRRQRQFEKRTVFQIAPDEEDEPDGAPNVAAAQPHKPNLKPDPPAQLDIKVSSPPTPPVTSGIPFPSSSEAAVESSLPFPSLVPPATPGSRASSISRSGSTPIVLANGKPLKSSLKSSVSSPQIADWRAQHPRTRSEPSTPLNPKTVHFPERKDNLENVVLFKKSARPRAVSGNADDTETETEGYDSPANAAILAGKSGSLPSENLFGLEIDPDQSSPVPPVDPPAFSNIHVETLVFPRTRPPTLCGSVLVKNVAFEKSVALRFTLDNWQTTSEVVCRHVCNLPSLPSPFPPERTSPGSPQLTWDRFSFVVRLEDVERKLAERTIVFAARFKAPGVGEWWDNNHGSNYKLTFRKSVSVAGPPPKAPSPLRSVDGPKKMFPSLDLRPLTTLLPHSDQHIPPLRLKKPFSPSSSPPKSTLSPPTPSNVTVAPPPPMNSTTANAAGAHQRTTSNSSIASSGSSGSLRLSNYVPPTSPIPTVGGSHNRNSISMMPGPLDGGHPISLGPPSVDMLTPRGEPLTLRPSPNNSFSSAGPPSASSSTTPTPTSLGAPSTPSSGDRTPPANILNELTKTNGSAYPLSTTDSSYAALVEKWCFHQSSPPHKSGSPSMEASTPGFGVTNGSLGVPEGFEAAAAGYGSGYGYGHHHPKPMSLAMKP